MYIFYVYTEAFCIFLYQLKQNFAMAMPDNNKEEIIKKK